MTALGEDLRADRAPFTRAALEESVIDRWRVVVAAHRHEPAVSAPDGLFTFDELDRRAEAVAAELDAGDGRAPLGELVLVLAGHDAAALAAVLAIWKTGRVVAVLDPTLPAKRIRRLVATSRARWCVASADQLAVARAAGVAQVLDLSRIESPSGGRTAADAPAPSAPRDPDAVGQVVFTSGSTGEPRGVWYSHRFLVHDAWSRGQAGWSGPSDVVAVPLPLAYAGGFGACFGALLCGASVHLWDPRVHGVGGVADSRLALEPTVVVSTPSMLSAIAGGVARGGELAAPLRLVISTGERYPACEARALLAVLPAGCRLVNVLGASETGLIAAFEVTPDLLDEGVGLPAGRPLPDKRIALVPDGEASELHGARAGSEGLLAVASRYTAGGYWQDEAGTAQTFRRDDDGDTVVTTGDVAHRRPDGCLEVVGRRGLTVKVRGYRVEPAEVEAEIRALPRVRDAVVIGYERAPGVTQLAAYVTFDGGHGMTSSGIRRELRERLPGFMVPEVVMPLADLPRTERGKVDRAALPTPSTREARPFEAPGTIWELIIADVWKDALGVSEVGLHDDFFELGGDSLAVEEVCSRLTDDYGLTPDSRSLVAAPTLLEFAEAVVYRRRRVAPRAMVPIRVTGTEPPLFCVAGGGGVGLCFLPLARRLDPHRPVWALQAHNLESAGLPDRSVARVARRNIAELREVQPAGPYHLLGYSFGGLVAFEMAHQLRDAGEEVALLVIVDSFAPDPRLVVCDGEPQAKARRLRWRARVAASTLLPSVGRGHYIRFYRQSAALGRRYRGVPWDGETLVITSQDEPLPGRAAEAWSAFLTGSWRSVAAPGRHEAVLREPWVAALAEPLDLALRSAADGVG